MRVLHTLSTIEQRLVASKPSPQFAKVFNNRLHSMGLKHPSHMSRSLRAKTWRTVLSPSSIRKQSTVHITFIDRDNQERSVQATPGETLLSLAQRNELQIEGACGGTCACSTCHIIIENQHLFHKLPQAEDREFDMLDMAYGLTETSRLACQLKVNEVFEAAKLRVPQYGGFTRVNSKA